MKFHLKKVVFSTKYYIHTMEKFGLHSRLKAAKGKGEELSSILLKAADLVAKVKGCQLYLVSQDAQNKDHIWVTEVWDSKEDHGNSLQSAKVKKLIVKALPILEDQPEGNSLEVLGGFGLS